MFCRFPPDGVKPNNVVIYRAKVEWGKSVKVVTFLVFVLVLSVMIFSLYVCFIKGEIAGILMVTVICLGILTIPYLFAPKSFELTKSGVVVRRLLKSFEIPYSKIRKAYLTDIPILGVRLWASGGLYGYYGLYYLQKFGRTWIYATRRKNVLLLEVNGNRYVISPKNPEEFLKLLEKFIQPKVYEQL